MRLDKWGARGLVGSWVVYWAGLLAVKAGPALWKWLTLQISQEHGTVSLSYSGSLLELGAWIAGPPLALTTLWLLTRPRRRAASRGVDGPRQLPERPSLGVPSAADSPRAAGEELPVRGPPGDIRR